MIAEAHELAHQVEGAERVGGEAGGGPLEHALSSIQLPPVAPPGALGEARSLSQS